MLVTVEVTAEDIAQGDPGGCWGCPVALALNRATGYAWSVNPFHLILPRPGRKKNLDIKTPPEVAEFISRFDAEKKVEPFTFTLNIPD